MSVKYIAKVTAQSVSNSSAPPLAAGSGMHIGKYGQNNQYRNNNNTNTINFIVLLLLWYLFLNLIDC